MLFRFFIAALAINFACSSAAHAKGCGNDLADAKRRVTGISRNVAATIGLFEQVPPDVAAYIDAESREASAQGNQERLDIVTRHPFYRAHPSGKCPDRSLRPLRCRLQVSGFDASRPQRAVSETTGKTLAGYLNGTKYGLHNALRCEIRVLKEP